MSKFDFEYDFRPLKMKNGIANCYSVLLNIIENYFFNFDTNFSATSFEDAGF